MAARFWIGTGDGNWGSTNNWSDTSGGATGFSVPTSADDVIFDGNGNNPCTVNSTTRNCLSFTIQGTYTNTITHSVALRVGGNITLHTGYTISGAAALEVTANSTITSNGKTWPNSFVVRLASVVTLSGNFTVGGTFTSIINQSCTVNLTTSETLYCNGVFVGESILGTVTLELTGGTWSGGTRAITTNLRLNGNITISGGVFYSTNTITYVSGVITTTGSTIQVNSSSTWDVSGITWNNLTWSGVNTTVTLTSDLNISGTLTLGGGTNCIANRATSEVINCSGIVQTGNVSFSGTAELYLLNGSTWTSTGSSGNIAKNTFINGDITISGNAYFGSPSNPVLTYLSGTIVVTGSTLILTTSIIDTDGMTWNNITTPTLNQTITINSTLTIAGVLNCSTSTIFAGTSGFNTNTFLNQAINVVTITLQNSVTYTINNLFDAHTSRIGSIVLFTSDHASLRANILMPNNGNNSCNILANFRRIDASGGRTIPTFNGTITDCLNIVEFHDLPTSSHAL
jgi:hypothetical protein